jgi:hypothetical protein
MSGAAILLVGLAGMAELIVGTERWTSGVRLSAFVIPVFWLPVAVNWADAAGRFAALVRAGRVRGTSDRAADLPRMVFGRAARLRVFGAVLSLGAVSIAVTALVNLIS